MKRLAVFFAIFTIGALLPALPAAATSGTGSSQSASGQCTSGSSCQAQLSQWISVKGSSASPTPTFNNTVAITPPPCLWNPIGDATVGSNAIIGEWGKDPKQAPTNFQINQSVQQADDLLKKPAPGEWYELPVNPNASTAGQAECLKLPLYAWVPPNQVPPGVNIPPQTLAQVAFASVQTPTVSDVQLNPVGNSETNLPTFVRATLADGGGLKATPDGKHAYTWVTAQLKGGNEAATVWVISDSLILTPGNLNANVYNGCGHTEQTANGVTLGSGTPADQMAQTQANQAIDCGVTYREPGTSTLQVSVGWTACWAPVDNANGAPPPAGCQAVPGAGNLTPAINGKNVNVQDIQSVNG